MFQRAAIVYFSLATAVHAQTVVPNNNITFSVGLNDIISIDVSKYPEHGFGSLCYSVGCFTEVNVKYDGAILSVDSIAIDESSDWLLVQPGDTFSAATIAAQQFPVFVGTNVPPGGPLMVGSNEFYLGVRTGAGFSGTPGNPGPANRTAYGWVHLRPVDGVLTMVENVMSYNSRGIVVGTTTVVPEPASLEIVLFGVGMIAARRRRGRDPFRIAPSFNAVD
jgi:hypothetical protein